MLPQLFQLRQQSSIIDKNSGDQITQPNVSNIYDTESQELAPHESICKCSNYEDKANSTDDDPFLALQSDNETPNFQMKAGQNTKYEGKKSGNFFLQSKTVDAPLLFSSLTRDKESRCHSSLARTRTSVERQRLIQSGQLRYRAKSVNVDTARRFTQQKVNQFEPFMLSYLSSDKAPVVKKTQTKRTRLFQYQSPTQSNECALLTPSPQKFFNPREFVLRNGPKTPISCAYQQFKQSLATTQTTEASKVDDVRQNVLQKRQDDTVTRLRQADQQNFCSTISAPKYRSVSCATSRSVSRQRLKSTSPYTNRQIRNAEAVKEKMQQQQSHLEGQQRGAYDAIISERERGFLLNSDQTIMNALLSRERTPKQQLILLQHELRDKALPQNVDISSDFARPKTPSQVQDNRETMHIIKSIGGFQHNIVQLLDQNELDNVNIKSALMLQQMEDAKLITPRTLPRVEQYVKGEKPLKECCIVQRPFDAKFYLQTAAK